MTSPEMPSTICVIGLRDGAGGGFGEGIARHFASFGAQELTLDMRADAAESVAAAIIADGGKAIAKLVAAT